MTNGDRLITGAQAAELAGVSRSTIRSWVGRGLLRPAVGSHHGNLYRVRDVDAAEAHARKRDVTGKARHRLQ